MPAELARTNAYSYSLATLNFFSQFCIISHKLGKDEFTLNKNRYMAAIRFLLPYMENHEGFPYQQINGWKEAKSGFDTIIRRFSRVYGSLVQELLLSSSNFDIQSIEDLMFL